MEPNYSLIYLLNTMLKKFILISSDKAVRPTNYMGATKRIAEILCLIEIKKKQTKFSYDLEMFQDLLVRQFLYLINKYLKEDLSATDPKIERYFMTIQEAAELVIQASSMTSKKVEIFILDMGTRIKFQIQQNKY